MSEQNEGMHRVRIVVDAMQPVVEIGGQDVSRLLHSYEVRQQAGQAPTVVLELAAHRTTALEGLARVVVGVPPDPGPAAAAFLQAIDAAQLEQAALARHDLQDGKPNELTRAMLHLLGEWARGQWAGWEPS
ncbi:hypothetical protein ACFQ6U_18980 [Streptomyces sp. NPDC056465]|uniref:hypothetical protein n=1 Tax=Streptomyces sp. NPDC056465 TaxID=3345829 RepID=UPI0036A2E5EE